MAVPKQKKSRARVKTRRGTQGIRTKKAEICPKCKSLKLPHTVCKVCGTYNGREVIDLEKRKKRKERKMKQEKEEEKES